MQLILTPPSKVVVNLKEISFNCGSPPGCIVKNYQQKLRLSEIMQSTNITSSNRM